MKLNLSHTSASDYYHFIGMKLAVNYSKAHTMSYSKSVILSGLLIITSCFHLGLSQTQYTPIKQVSCTEKPTEFHLFYEGESLPFKYEKIGAVSATENGLTFNDRDLFNTLKFYAWTNCANGLLFIKSGFTGAESQKYYTAVAVRIEIDADFTEKYGSGADLSFVQQFAERQAVQKQQQKAGIGVTFVGILLLIFLLTQLQLD